MTRENVLEFCHAALQLHAAAAEAARHPPFLLRTSALKRVQTRHQNLERDLVIVYLNSPSLVLTHSLTLHLELRFKTYTVFYILL